MRSTWICGLHIKAAAGSLRLELGVKFDTLAAVELAIRAHENQLGISYWRRDTRTIEAADKRVKNVSVVSARVKGNVQYYELRYCCIKGGRQYTPRAKVFTPSSMLTLQEVVMCTSQVSANRSRECVNKFFGRFQSPPNICDTSK